MPDSVGSGSEDFRQAEWLVNQPEFAGKWRYDHTTEKWHHWDGIRWAPDDVRRRNRTIRDIIADRIKSGNVPNRDVMKLLSLAPQERALTAVSSLEGYGTNGDDWDSDPVTLGAKNGIVDLTTNKLVARPTSDNLVTKTTGVNFVPLTEWSEAFIRAPEFMRVMDEWTSGDAAMTSFLLLWFGSSMFGFSPEQRFLLMTGIGRNGKGALRHSVMRAVGEYGAQFDSNLYMRSKFGAARSDSARADLMALKGKRITFFSEPSGGHFNEELLKAHTGGDQIVARALYSNNIQTWDPTHSITFLVNNVPEIEDIGPSMAARVMVADFRERFDGDREDKQLYGTLEREAEGILAILCWAAAAWYSSWSSGRGGITLPPRVVDQSRRFMERNDPISAMLDESFKVAPGLMGQGQLVYDTYKDWHNKNGDDTALMAMNQFSLALEKKGFHKVKKESGNFWLGLAPLSAMDRAMRGDDDDEGDE